MAPPLGWPSRPECRRRPPGRGVRTLCGPTGLALTLLSPLDGRVPSKDDVSPRRSRLWSATVPGRAASEAWPTPEGSDRPGYRSPRGACRTPLSGPGPSWRPHVRGRRPVRGLQLVEDIQAFGWSLGQRQSCSRPQRLSRGEWTRPMSYGQPAALSFRAPSKRPRFLGPVHRVPVAVSDKAMQRPKRSSTRRRGRSCHNVDERQPWGRSNSTRSRRACLLTSRTCKGFQRSTSGQLDTIDLGSCVPWGS